MMTCITYHKRDGTAVPKSHKYMKTRYIQRRFHQTTISWKLLVQWNNVSNQWIDLKLLKESNHVQVSEYAVPRDINDEPAFGWWVPNTLLNRDVIIAAIDSIVKQTTHKHVIEVHKSINESMAIDNKNGNNYWTDTINLEMTNVGVAFEVLLAEVCAPPGWIKSSGHIIFYVKMYYTRKARWVKDGHQTPGLLTSIYDGVVSRESVRIALTRADLLGIDTMAADIRNAYLQSPSYEKEYITYGPDFGILNVGRVDLIRRALSGGKVAGRDF